MWYHIQVILGDFSFYPLGPKKVVQSIALQIWPQKCVKCPNMFQTKMSNVNQNMSENVIMVTVLIFWEIRWRVLETGRVVPYPGDSYNTIGRLGSKYLFVSFFSKSFWHCLDLLVVVIHSSQNVIHSWVLNFKVWMLFKSEVKENINLYYFCLVLMPEIQTLGINLGQALWFSYLCH